MMDFWKAMIKLTFERFIGRHESGGKEYKH